jgi:hypothetical protein
VLLELWLGSQWDAECKDGDVWVVWANDELALLVSSSTDVKRPSLFQRASSAALISALTSASIWGKLVKRWS